MFTKIMLIIALILFSSPSFSDVRVRGFYRKDGTFVQPHFRSNPNSTPYDNWTTKGNINPYTGKKGTKNVYPVTRKYQELSKSLSSLSFILKQINNLQIEKIGYFGKDTVELYQYNNGCFISLYGRNNKESINSVSIWDPKNPKIIILFPFSHTVGEAINVLKNAINKAENLKNQISYNYLLFDKKIYNLIGKYYENKFSMLIANLDKNPTNILINGSYFLAKFKDPENNYGFRNSVFGLYGFSAALAAYQAYCEF